MFEGAVSLRASIPYFGVFTLDHSDGPKFHSPRKIFQKFIWVFINYRQIGLNGDASLTFLVPNLPRFF
jgi:hypothetical protein